jgi:hypothetical protein
MFFSFTAFKHARSLFQSLRHAAVLTGATLIPSATLGDITSVRKRSAFDAAASAFVIVEDLIGFLLHEPPWSIR